jgi:hypothetical protein
MAGIGLNNQSVQTMGTIILTKLTDQGHNQDHRSNPISAMIGGGSMMMINNENNEHFNNKDHASISNAVVGNIGSVGNQTISSNL